MREAASLRRGIVVGSLAFASLAGAAALAHAHTGEAAVAAPIDFAPPTPGTYRLPVIMAAPDGTVLTTDGQPRPLHDFTHGKVTLLSLIYTRCSDAEGCPRAAASFIELRRLLGHEPALARQVRLVSLSFDPAHDTPGALRAYARRVGATRGTPAWHFLTTRSAGELRPLLDGFDQDVRISTDPAQGDGPAALTHVLKVFLIDPLGEVREIYTTSYLASAVLVNDIRTLLLEAPAGR